MIDYSRFTMPVSKSCISQGTVNFDIHDPKGRQLGVYVLVTQSEYAPHDGTYHAFSRCPVGCWVFVTIQQIRSNMLFGAGQSSTRFASLEEAQVHVAKTIEKRRATYAKQFA